MKRVKAVAVGLCWAELWLAGLCLAGTGQAGAQQAGTQQAGAQQAGTQQAGAQQAGAQPVEHLVVTPETSQVRMTLKTNHETVEGTFRVQSGAVEVDRSGGRLAGAVVVLAGSGETGNGMRDRRMNKEILKVEQFAEVRFAPQSYTGVLGEAGDWTIAVTGVLTLLGSPHTVTIPMQVHLAGGAATVRAHFVVPYVQWGVKNPSLLMWKAEPDVAIDVVLRGRETR